MRILMIGDVVGRPGRNLLKERLAKIRDEYQLDFVIANVENAAGGSGVSVSNYREFCDMGIDCMTLGDHAFRQREIYPLLESESNIVRPGNYPKTAPGKAYTILEIPQRPSKSSILSKSTILPFPSQSIKKSDNIIASANTVTPVNIVGATDIAPSVKRELPVEPVKIAVFVLLGRTFMQPVNCPLEAADSILAEIPAEVAIRFLDFHAEATSDKQLMGRSLDGRVSAVLGTHTHVATADETIFPGGTAFQCDVGMTGPFESIIGREISRVSEAIRTFRPVQFDVAKRDVRINATLVEVDSQTGKARSIERLVFRENS